MSGISKKKLCWNCETRVTLQQENCSFCGVYLSPSTDLENDFNILTAPYQVQSQQDRFEIPGAPFNQNELDEEVDKALEPSSEIDETLSIKLVTFTIAFLFLGSIFLLFSAFMFMFSQNGTLTLRWSTDYWYILLSLAIPLLFFGWKGLKSIPENS